MKNKWITEGFESFREGTFGNGGQNIYVSRNGILQRIYQYDLTHNGYFDLVFANCQNHHEAAPAYIYDREGSRTELPAQGAQCGNVADLTGNGFMDIIVPGYYDMAAPFASVDIYYGGLDGYSEKRHIRIPAPYTEDCCHGNFLGNSKPALVFAMPVYKTVRIFFQTDIGFEWTHFVDLPIECNLVASCDLDGDGYDELIVRKKEQTETTVYWGGPDGIKTERYTILPEIDASEIVHMEKMKGCQSTLERQFQVPRLLQTLKFKGRNIFTLSTGKKMIFYGANKDRKLEAVLELDVPMAHSVSIGDLTGRGTEDIAVACRHRKNKDSEKQTSFIFLEGNYRRPFILDTYQACDVKIGDFEGPCAVFCQNATDSSYTNRIAVFRFKEDSFVMDSAKYISEDARRIFIINNPGCTPLLAVINHYSRSCIGFDKSYIYTGSADGYSPERRLEIPGWCAVDSLCADLNDDGWAELIICNNAENSLHLDPGHYVHHFNADGFKPERIYTLKTDIGWGAVVGDFNHNGYVDVVTVCNHWQDIRIFHGGPDGFNTSEDISLHGFGNPRWILAVDINNNGWLDLIIPIISGDRSLILWGGAEGFSMERRSELAVFHGVCAHAADLTKNGYPDLIIGGHTLVPEDGELPRHLPHHSFVYIYWNGPDGIDETNKTVLRADAATSICVGDFNNDGWLDIFAGSYHGGKERDINSFIYWNRNGTFRELDCKLLYTHSVSGCLAADFNEDGYVDLAVANHKVNGDHHGFSSVWWNGTEGFNAKNRTDLPTEGPHGISSIEPGNILDRGPEEYYTSVSYFIKENSLLEFISWEGEIPGKTWVKAAFRTAGAERQLDNSQWSEWFDNNQAIGLELHSGIYLQYKLALGALNSLRSPRITKVTVSLLTGGQAQV